MNLVEKVKLGLKYCSNTEDYPIACPDECPYCKDYAKQRKPHSSETVLDYCRPRLASDCLKAIDQIEKRTAKKILTYLDNHVGCGEPTGNLIHKLADSYKVELK